MEPLEQSFAKNGNCNISNFTNKTIYFEKRFDPLIDACRNSSFIIVKAAIYDCVLANNLIENPMDVMKKFECLMLLCNFVPDFRTFLKLNKIDYMEICKTIKLIKNNEKFLLEFVFDVIHGNENYCTLAKLSFMDKAPESWTCDQLKYYVKYFFFKNAIRNKNFQIGNINKMLEKISDENINGGHFLKLDSSEFNDLDSICSSINRLQLSSPQRAGRDCNFNCNANADMNINANGDYNIVNANANVDDNVVNANSNGNDNLVNANANGDDNVVNEDEIKILNTELENMATKTKQLEADLLLKEQQIMALSKSLIYITTKQSSCVANQAFSNVEQQQSLDVANQSHYNVSHQSASSDHSKIFSNVYTQYSDVLQQLSSKIEQQQSSNIEQQQSFNIQQQQSSNIQQQQSSNIESQQSLNIELQQSHNIEHQQSTNIEQQQSSSVSHKQYSDVANHSPSNSANILSSNYYPPQSPNSANKQSLTIEQQPSNVSNQQYSNVEQQHPNVHNPPSSNVDQQQSYSVSHKQSLGVSDQSSLNDANQQPLNIEQQHSNVSNQPYSNVDKQPSNVEKQPSYVDNKQCSNVYHPQSSDVDHKLSSNIKHQQSSNIYHYELSSTVASGSYYNVTSPQSHSVDNKQSSHANAPTMLTTKVVKNGRKRKNDTLLPMKDDEKFNLSSLKSMADVESLTVVELRLVLGQNELSKGGRKKKELVKRLWDFVNK